MPHEQEPVDLEQQCSSKDVEDANPELKSDGSDIAKVRRRK
jgi:hypothetical protein